MNARIVEAERTSENSRGRRYFVKSASTPGVWWRVDYVPGLDRPFTCSCPWGRRVTDNGARACRHLVAVCTLIADERRAVA